MSNSFSHPARHIRNFCIIAHIDHGKSTLADRFLELTGTIRPEKMRAQFLDRLESERERGITIKMAPVRMIFHMENHTESLNSNLEILNKSQTKNSQIQNNLEIRNSDLEIAGSEYILNLIDTPGHVDFSYEVSRALAAVEGAILLVDATQGIQAQTLANLEIAKKQNLKVIGAVNKIDLVDKLFLEERVLELAEILDVKPEEIHSISAKTGKGITALLQSVIIKIPPPEDRESASLARGLVFDSHFDSFKGVIAHTRVFNGVFVPRGKAHFIAKNIDFEIKETGYFTPDLSPANEISEGEIGYIATGLKNSDLVRIGDTIIGNWKLEIGDTIIGNWKLEIGNCTALPGYKEPMPVVFAGLFPAEESDYQALKDALAKHRLNDASLFIESWHQEGLGKGFRLGFLGLLHLEITQERLSKEIGIETVITFPSVAYKITITNGSEVEIISAAQLPDESSIKEIKEPWINMEILTPQEYLNSVMNALKSRRGHFLSQEPLFADQRGLPARIDADKSTGANPRLDLGRSALKVRWSMPLADFLSGFYDELKSVSSGFASLSYQVSEYQKGDLVKVDILIANKKFDEFSRILPRESVEQKSRQTLLKLKEALPRENFAVALQAVIGGKIIARETIPALRKDVTGYLYGGDRTRKMKLWKKQARGKKRLKEHGVVIVPTKTIIEILKAK